MISAEQLQVGQAVPSVPEFIIKIQDNGKGMSEEKLNRLEEALENPSKNRLSSIGVHNVRERIKLQYGQAYGLDIRSIEGEGTIVTIHMPCIPAAKEEQDHEASSR